MKVLWASLGLLLILACGEALKCNRCVPVRVGGTCTTKVEDCRSDMDACVSAKTTSGPYHHFRRCIKMSGCKILQGIQTMKVKCCETDRCN